MIISNTYIASKCNKRLDSIAAETRIEFNPLRPSDAYMRH